MYCFISLYFVTSLHCSWGLTTILKCQTYCIYSAAASFDRQNELSKIIQLRILFTLSPFWMCSRNHFPRWNVICALTIISSVKTLHSTTKKRTARWNLTWKQSDFQRLVNSTLSSQELAVASISSPKKVKYKFSEWWKRSELSRRCRRP